MKDNFSAASGNYAKYRPTYPQALFEYIFSLVAHKEHAWDCGTGNGQVAFELAKQFKTVEATDISQNQMNNAAAWPNITYSLQPAEKTNFPDGHFDLVTVAQAIHWFQFEAFYKEVKRTTKKNAILSVIGYGRVRISKEIDALESHFYHEVVGPYWDPERKHIDDAYATLPFPFEELQTPRFENTNSWTLAHFIGYLNTWSAVKHFIKRNGYNPVDNLQEKLLEYWGLEEYKTVIFPLFLRVGKVHGP